MDVKIAVLEGDGIGPEITAEALKTLDAVADRFGHSFDLTHAPFGANGFFSEGAAFPDKTKAICDAADVIIKGPVGLAVEEMAKIPQEERPECGAILPLRKRYDTYANFRPIRLPKGLAEFSPLRQEIIGDGLDILMIRELVGGIYFGDKVEGNTTGMAYASDACVYTDEQVRRVAILAFEEARARGCGLIDVHKANVLATSRFWTAVVSDVAKSYSDVPYQAMLVDNAAYQLVINPTHFNGVVLFENMQGDILTDQAGGIIGSLGLMPSACVGPEKSYVEPAHGSAPDIAGKNLANPYSMIGSMALMFERCLSLPEEGDAVWKALFAVFEDGYRSADLASSSTPDDKVLSTTAFGDEVVCRIRG